MNKSFVEFKFLFTNGRPQQVLQQLNRVEDKNEYRHDPRLHLQFRTVLDLDRLVANGNGRTILLDCSKKTDQVLRMTWPKTFLPSTRLDFKSAKSPLPANMSRKQARMTTSEKPPNSSINQWPGQPKFFHSIFENGMEISRCIGKNRSLRWSRLADVRWDNYIFGILNLNGFWKS